jgi:hypothetical protein
MHPMSMCHTEAAGMASTIEKWSGSSLSSCRRGTRFLIYSQEIINSRGAFFRNYTVGPERAET